MKNIKAFTLTEMIICTLLAGIVIFFVYTIMLSSNKSYVKLYNYSKNKNDIVYFKNLLRKSIMNSNSTNSTASSAEYKNIRFGNNTIEIGYYDSLELNDYRVDKYCFSSDIVSYSSDSSHYRRYLSLKDLSLSSLSKSASVDLEVYRGEITSNRKIVAKSLHRKEKILGNGDSNNNIYIDRIYWHYNPHHGPSGTHHYYYYCLYMSIVYHIESKGENPEYSSDFFIFKNNFYDNFGSKF